MKVYGIKNCNSVKKSLDLLSNKGVEYEFVDFKKTPPQQHQVVKWIDSKGFDVVINKKGMMWRKLPDEAKENLNQESAVELALEKPSIIKRPLVEVDGNVLIGVDELEQHLG
mgnify:CR=1 FL=1